MNPETATTVGDGGGSSELCICTGIDGGRHKDYCPQFRPWWQSLSWKLRETLSEKDGDDG